MSFLFFTIVVAVATSHCFYLLFHVYVESAQQRAREKMNLLLLPLLLCSFKYMRHQHCIHFDSYNNNKNILSTIFQYEYYMRSLHSMCVCLYAFKPKMMVKHSHLSSILLFVGTIGRGGKRKSKKLSPQGVQINEHIQ